MKGNTTIISHCFSSYSFIFRFCPSIRLLNSHLRHHNSCEETVQIDIPMAEYVSQRRLLFLLPVFFFLVIGLSSFGVNRGFTQ